MKELRAKAGDIIRTVATSGQEVTVTDSGTEIAVIISLRDYERLTKHADLVDSFRRDDFEQRATEPTASLYEILEQFDVSPSELAAP